MAPGGWQYSDECPDAVGMGVMLIIDKTLLKTEAFKKLPLPWFNVSYLPNGRMHIGEDIYFYKPAQAYGFKVYIDHDLSKEVTHIGLMEFTHDHAEACRDEVPNDMDCAAARLAETAE